MEYVFQFARILIFCFLGESLHVLLPLPIPASVYGLLMLLAALRLGIVRVEQVKTVGSFLTGLFLLLFIPGTVAIVEQLDLFKSLWLPALLAILPVTWAVFGVSGAVTERVIGRKNRE